MHCLGDYYTDVLQRELNEFKEPEEINYHNEFQDETKREVNPFKLRNFLSDKCNQKVDELTTNSKNGFSFKIKPILQLNFFSNIKKFEDFPCEITFQIFLNQTKGIIYLQNCELNEDLKKNSKRSVPIHRKLKWNEFHQVKELEHYGSTSYLQPAITAIYFV